MTPEERADNAVKDVANVIGGFPNTTARDIIACVIRAAVAAERERCLDIARTQPNYPDTHTGTRQQWVRDEIARRIRTGDAS